MSHFSATNIIHFSNHGFSKLLSYSNGDVEQYRPAQAGKWPAVFQKPKRGGWQHSRYPGTAWPYIVREPIIARDEFNVWKIMAKDNISQLKHLIEPRTLRNIRGFREGYQFGVEKFIWCVTPEYGTKFLDLNPSLGLMLANSPLFLNRSKSYLHNKYRRKMILKSWEEILVSLGFPRSKSLAQSLSRIPKRSIDLGLLLELRKSITREGIHALARIPTKIRLGVLPIILRQYVYDMVTPSLINEVSKRKDEEKKPITYFKLYEILRIEDSIRTALWAVPLRKQFRSLDELNAHHQLLVYELQSNRADKIKYPQVSTLRLSREEAGLVVEPIRTAAELHEEGLLMNHCIYSYHESATRGEVQVFKVLHPERLTLLVGIHPSGKHQLMEIRGKDNCKAEPSSELLAKNWLSNSAAVSKQSERIQVREAQWNLS